MDYQERRKETIDIVRNAIGRVQHFGQNADKQAVVIIYNDALNDVNGLLYELSVKNPQYKEAMMFAKQKLIEQYILLITDIDWDKVCLHCGSMIDDETP